MTNEIKINKDLTANETYILRYDKEYFYLPYYETKGEQAMSVALRAMGRVIGHKIVLYHARHTGYPLSKKLLVFVDDKFKFYYTTRNFDSSNANCRSQMTYAIMHDLIEALSKAGKFEVSLDINCSIKQISRTAKAMVKRNEYGDLFKDIIHEV